MSARVKAFIDAGNTCLAAGDRTGAALAWCRALDLDPHLATAFSNLGAVNLMGGAPWHALPCFLTATGLRPDQGSFWIGLARTLVELGQPARAAACLDAAAKRLPEDAALQDAARRYPADDAIRAAHDGFVNRTGQTAAIDRLDSINGQTDPADAGSLRDRARELIWCLPDRAALWLTLSRLALQTGDPLAAEFSARRAIALAPSEAAGWLALAKVLSRAVGRDDDVDRVLARSLELCGARLVLAEALCNRLIARGRPADARAALDALPADRIGPPARWVLLDAKVFEALGDRDAGAALFAAALDPEADPRALLLAAAEFHERDLVPGAWLALYDRAGAARVNLDQPDLDHARARALLRAGEVEEARAAIQKALAGPLSDDARRVARFAAGQIADRAGQHAEAWAHFCAGNQLLEQVWEMNGPCDHTVPLARLASLDQRLLIEMAGTVPAAVTPDAMDKAADNVEAGRDLAFLVGFPRSGTTLLDSILRSHSRIHVIEERPILIEALRTVVPGIAGDETLFTEAWLDEVDRADIAALRAAYRSRLAHHAGETADGVTRVDKLPLNMNLAAVIHRIFPAARFILARRHPLDVAVSNFAQDYAPNNAMMVMTRLERIARFHAASFDFWDRFVAWRKPRLASVVYEDLVDDPQAATANAMALLGHAWEPAQARFFDTARKRGQIATPSARQVTQPLYTGARGRWQHYAEPLSGAACEPLRARAIAWGYQVEVGACEPEITA